MRLKRARVTKYRCIDDTDWFDVELAKTILVGPNEAGKTALLEALQQLKAPDGIAGFVALRDYPRSQYNDIFTGAVNPADVTVVEGRFRLEHDDKIAVPKEYGECVYVCGRRLDNSYWHRIEGGPPIPTHADLREDLRLSAGHVEGCATDEQAEPPSAGLDRLLAEWPADDPMDVDRATALEAWLSNVLPLGDQTVQAQERRHNRFVASIKATRAAAAAIETLEARLPVFVLFNNYFRVRPNIHLDHLASRLETGVLDDESYDYGNQCLLKLLGFTARKLSDLGKATEPGADDKDALQEYRDQLDERRYQLNAASVRLSDEIKTVWPADTEKGDAERLRLSADGQYLKVVVEDDLGVEIELDQRSAGFQWLVSFFVVFFAEAVDKHENAILLLDEPGLSLHGLRQRDFRETLSRLSESNQTIYSTHSPFLVGPNELDRVRVVEMRDRKEGTCVHTTVTASDPAALLPLQEALGYDLAQSLFVQKRNLVLEGLTDYWYVEAAAQLLADAGEIKLNTKIALLPASSAGKVVYFATILHANQLKVAALLDSDNAGDQAAKQDVLVHTLGNKRILRTRDVYEGAVRNTEIEDLLRDTLVHVAQEKLEWDIADLANEQIDRPIVDIFESSVPDFSKYRLAKAFLRWARFHGAADLSDSERAQCAALVEAINSALK